MGLMIRNRKYGTSLSDLSRPDPKALTPDGDHGHEGGSCAFLLLTFLFNEGFFDQAVMWIRAAIPSCRILSDEGDLNEPGTSVLVLRYFRVNGFYD